MKINALVLILLFFCLMSSGNELQILNPYEHPTINNIGQLSEQKTWPDPDILDSLICDVIDSYPLAGIGTCIMKENEIIWMKGYGYRDISLQKGIDDSTTFLLASATKLITATAMMQLHDEGHFDLDDAVNQHMPDSIQIYNPNFPQESITFKQLLTHTSSINYNWDHLEHLISWGSDSEMPLAMFISSYLMPSGSLYDKENTFLNKLPGTQYQYSNEAITLAGYLVETISGQSFIDYTEEHIFSPLEMHNTFWTTDSMQTDNLAINYQINAEEMEALPYYGHPMLPAGWLKSSLKDLANFTFMYMNKGSWQNQRILDAETVDMMLTEQRPIVAPGIGLVWNILEGEESPLFIHDGGLFGAYTSLGHTGENEIGVVVLSNSDPTSAQYIIRSYLYNYAWFYNEIYPEQVQIRSRYCNVENDSNAIKVSFVNPNQHDFMAQAIIYNESNHEIEIIPLFDDGQHGDSLSADGVWANTIPAINEENTFSISIETKDLENGKKFIVNNTTHFTTVGPLTVEDYLFYSNDTIPNPDDNLKLKIRIKNNAISATAENITAELISIDTNAVVNMTSNPSFADISAGEDELMNGYFRILFLDTKPENTKAEFIIKIYSNEDLFWQDSLVIDIYEKSVGITVNKQSTANEFQLKQNFPNPFNPGTTINFNNPISGPIKIEVYSLTGEKLTTLIDDDLPAGMHSYKLIVNNWASGVYVYKLRTNRGILSKKMIYIR